jgi:myo-inositol 2-dehydrogenase/D-chiro-inositol 1-dehydrogenase
MTHTAPSPSRDLLRVAIVGLGRLGIRHARMLQNRVADCIVVAACSPVPAEQEAARALHIATVYSDYQQVLDDPQVQAVVLVTPTSLHASQVQMALQHHKHVLVEKPLALNVADCEAVEAVARQHPQLVAAVGFVRRFDPHYAQAMQHIRTGALGKPFMVRSQTADQHDPSGFFVKFSATSGGLFMDCSIHDIDLARWFLGKPKALRVYASGAALLHPDLAQHQDIDNGTAVIEFEGGLQAVLYASRTMAHGHQTHTEVIATQGSLTIGQGAERAQIEICDASGKRKPVVADFYERFEQAFEVELNAFVQACLGHAPMPLALNDATEATRIGLAITQSLHEQRVVHLGEITH